MSVNDLQVANNYLGGYFLALPVSDYGTNLRRLMTEKRIKGGDLAERVNATAAMVSKWRHGTLPSAKNRALIAEALGVSPGEIFEGDLSGHRGTGQLSDEAILIADDVHTGYEPDAIPVLAEGEATPQGLAWSTDVMRERAIEYLSRPYEVKDPDAYGVLVIGESMLPAYRKGHRVVVSPASPARDGDEVYVQLADGRRMIKLARRVPGGWRLESYNPAFETIEVQDADVLAIHPIVWSRRRIPGFRVVDDNTGRRR